MKITPFISILPGTNYHAPQLTDKECWDVAAFVNSQPRPHFDQHNDWTNISRSRLIFHLLRTTIIFLNISINTVRLNQ